MKNKKSFDAVEMMHQGAAKLQARLARMSDKEQSAFWQKRNEEFKKLQTKLRKQKRIAA